MKLNTIFPPIASDYEPNYAHERSTGNALTSQVDPNNNNRELLESDAIIKYLYDEYGDGNVSACLPAVGSFTLG